MKGQSLRAQLGYNSGGRVPIHHGQGRRSSTRSVRGIISASPIGDSLTSSQCHHSVRQCRSVSDVSVGATAVTEDAPEVAAAPASSFDWFKAWYPIAFAK